MAEQVGTGQEVSVLYVDYGNVRAECEGVTVIRLRVRSEGRV